MAGMRALGRVYNPVFAGAAGTAKVSMKECSGVGVLFTCTSTASSTITIKAATAYGNSYVATGLNAFPSVVYYQSAAGTAAWTAGTIATSGSPTGSLVASTGVITFSGATSGQVYYFDVLGSYLADTYDYLEVVASTDFTLVAIAYDLTVGRTPANLATISA